MKKRFDLILVISTALILATTIIALVFFIDSIKSAQYYHSAFNGYIEKAISNSLVKDCVLNGVVVLCSAIATGLLIFAQIKKYKSFIVEYLQNLPDRRAEKKRAKTEAEKERLKAKLEKLDDESKE